MPKAEAVNLLLTFERDGLICEQRTVVEASMAVFEAMAMIGRYDTLQAGDKLSVERDEDAPPIIPRQGD